jgi:Domain of unknown function (DUF4252)
MTPMTLTRSMAVAVLLTVPVANGCMWAPELTDVKQQIAQQLPDTGFRKDVTLSLGPVTLALARTITGLIPDAREARGYLHDVSRVQVAVYNVYSAGDVTSLDTPKRLQELLDDGWEMAVRVRDDDQVAWLLYRLDDKSVREMFVVVMDKDDLVLVKLKGHLEKLIAHALEEPHGDWSHFAHHGA